MAYTMLDVETEDASGVRELLGQIPDVIKIRILN